MVQTIFVAILAGNGPGFSPDILASMIRIADKSRGEGSWLVAGSTLDFRTSEISTRRVFRRQRILLYLLTQTRCFHHVPDEVLVATGHFDVGLLHFFHIW